MNEVTITQDEAIALSDILEFGIFALIRSDEDADNIMWLCNLCNVYKKCKMIEDSQAESENKG